MVWIKICGITNVEDALKISELGADALGFVLSTESARKITPRKAKEIILAVNSNFKNSGCKKYPLTAGVFVNEDIEKVLQITSELGFDYIQLSGDENKVYLEKIKKNNKAVKLIKLIRIKNDISSVKEELIRMQDFKKTADFFLLDTFKENIYGGTGETFCWDIVRDLGLYFPVILAGGLEPSNVNKAIQTVKPFGVDASSKLEKSPGEKDIFKVESFIKNAGHLIKNIKSEKKGR